MAAMVTTANRAERRAPFRKHEISALIDHDGFGDIGREASKEGQIRALCRAGGTAHKPLEPF
jgi:hypothetical protein